MSVIALSHDSDYPTVTPEEEVDIHDEIQSFLSSSGVSSPLSKSTSIDHFPSFSGGRSAERHSFANIHHSVVSHSAGVSPTGGKHTRKRRDSDSLRRKRKESTEVPSAAVAHRSGSAAVPSPSIRDPYLTVEELLRIPCEEVESYPILSTLLIIALTSYLYYLFS
ncbi:hypothetical protein AGDE_16415 [Angomonas deanei]|nr:hypothetical protein AGDE_16415 [Angomonas deanei]|eukprot:EPY17130.1 hypothetical protein AGDE_16415 [Angomonas deanei]